MDQQSPIKCKICNETALFLCDINHRHNLIKILHCYCCYNCGLTFIGDELSSEELQIAYALPNYEQYYEEIFNENKRKMESAINTLTKIIPNDNKIIDIGTGNGLFVKLLLKHEIGRAHV